MIQRENEMKPLSQTPRPSGETLYDLSILQEMDDRDYIVEIVTMFLNDTPGEMKEIREALLAADTEGVSKKAHKLKSSAGILQASQLIGLLSDIERIAKAGKTDEKLRDLFERAQEQYRELEQALQKLLKTI